MLPDLPIALRGPARTRWVVVVQTPLVHWVLLKFFKDPDPTIDVNNKNNNPCQTFAEILLILAL